MHRFSIFMDWSGAVTEESATSSAITVAGVAIPSASVDDARQAVGVPAAKWSGTWFAEASRVLQAGLKHASACIVLRLEKQEPAWSEFWRDGRDLHRKLTSSLKRKYGVIKPATLVKYHLIGQCLARLLGECIKLNAVGGLVNPRGFRPIEMRVICDTEIQGSDNTEQYNYLWQNLQWGQNLVNQYGFVVRFSEIELLSEQQELLINIPDYLAGMYHCYLDPQVSLPPRLSRSELELLVKQTQGTQKVAVATEQFRITYQEIFPI
jgi:hypothetical protein